VRARILEVQEKAGFRPPTLSLSRLRASRRPRASAAFFAYHDALLAAAQSGLSKG
jgi:hypothetical protein